MGAYGQAGAYAMGMGGFPGGMMPGTMYPGDMNAQAYGGYMGGMMMGNPWGFPSASSAAAFHIQGPKNEIKLFVGGLQFQTLGKMNLDNFV